jgi:hypothetical protein
MKKILLVILAAALSLLSLTACNSNTNTVDQSWADAETLTYSMYDSSVGSEKIGGAVMSITTNLTEADKTACPDADTKLTADVTRTGVCLLSTVYYAKGYRVLTLTRTYTDLADDANSYILKATHSGKNYRYSLSYPGASQKNKSGSINVGSTGYTDNEFLYYYIRCYAIGSVPSSIKVADPFTDTAVKLTTSYKSDAATVTSDTDKLGSVVCNSVSISKSSSPVGNGITVYYLPDTSTYSYGDHTVIKSVKFPVKIVENNISYVLGDFEVSR